MNIRGKSGTLLTEDAAFYAMEGPREQVIAELQTIIEDCQDALLRLPLRSLCAQMESGLRALEQEAAEYLSDLVNEDEDEDEDEDRIDAERASAIISNAKARAIIANAKARAIIANAQAR